MGAAAPIVPGQAVSAPCGIRSEALLAVFAPFLPNLRLQPVLRSDDGWQVIDDPIDRPFQLQMLAESSVFGAKMTARVTRIPSLSEVPYPVQMEPNLVIEFYSR